MRRGRDLLGVKFSITVVSVACLFEVSWRPATMKLIGQSASFFEKFALKVQLLNASIQNRQELVFWAAPPLQQPSVHVWND